MNDDIGLLVDRTNIIWTRINGKSYTATRTISCPVQVFVSLYQILKAYILFRHRIRKETIYVSIHDKNNERSMQIIAERMSGVAHNFVLPVLGNMLFIFF